MGKEGIATVKGVGDGIALMLPEGDFRVHASKDDVTAIILTGTYGVHFLVVLLDDCLTAIRITPDPVFECFPDHGLLLGCQGGFLGVQHPLFLTLIIINSVINANIPEVQRILQDVIGTGPVCAVGAVRGNIIVQYFGFVGDVPCGGVGRILHLNGVQQTFGGIKGFIHKLLDIGFVDPGGTQTDFNFRSIQVFGLGSTESFHIDHVSRIIHCRSFRLPQFLSDITGKILVRSLPSIQRGR